MKRYTTQFVRALAEQHGRTQAHYHQALMEILNGITRDLAKGNSVQFIGFGTFYTRDRPPSTLKSLATGRQMMVPARRVTGFRVGELVKRAVASKPVGRPPRQGGRVTSLLSRAGAHLMRPRARGRKRAA